MLGQTKGELNMKVYQKISNIIELINTDNNQKHIDLLDATVKEYLPSGSGFNYNIECHDCDTERLVFLTSFATMDEHGYYGEIIDLEFIITPDLQFGMNLEIKFLNYPELKEDYDDYFGDTWWEALDKEIDESASKTKVYQEISGKLKAIENCKRVSNPWEQIHTERLEELISKYLPNDPCFIYPISCSFVSPELIIFKTKFKYLDENTNSFFMCEFIIKPSLQNDLFLEVNYFNHENNHTEQTKDYFYKLWFDALTQNIKEN